MLHCTVPPSITFPVLRSRDPQAQKKENSHIHTKPEREEEKRGRNKGKKGHLDYCSPPPRSNWVPPSSENDGRASTSPTGTATTARARSPILASSPAATPSSPAPSPAASRATSASRLACATIMIVCAPTPYMYPPTPPPLLYRRRVGQQGRGGPPTAQEGGVARKGS